MITDDHAGANEEAAPFPAPLRHFVGEAAKIAKGRGSNPGLAPIIPCMPPDLHIRWRPPARDQVANHYERQRGCN
jgi:hypothetical protein